MKDSLKNTFPLDGMKHSLKNTFPLYEKTASSGKKVDGKVTFGGSNV